MLVVDAHNDEASRAERRAFSNGKVSAIRMPEKWAYF